MSETSHSSSPRRTRPRRSGFTLIELLIVVAIVALLAAIALPNLLEAQTRAKVSRAKADLRAVMTGLEAYHVDYNDYPPNDGVFNVLPIQITTPVAFLTDSRLVDPFSDKELHPVHGELARFYTYTRIVSWEEFLDLQGTPFRPPIEAIDSYDFNFGALEKYGKWRLVSNGPDREYSDREEYADTDPVLWGSDIPYDPTNGTVSWGNIVRTQREAELRTP